MRDQDRDWLGPLGPCLAASQERRRPASVITTSTSSSDERFHRALAAGNDPIPHEAQPVLDGAAMHASPGVSGVGHSRESLRLGAPGLWGWALQGVSTVGVDRARRRIPGEENS